MTQFCGSRSHRSERESWTVHQEKSAPGAMKETTMAAKKKAKKKATKKKATKKKAKKK